MIAKITAGKDVNGLIRYQSKDSYLGINDKNKSKDEPLDNHYSELLMVANPPLGFSGTENMGEKKIIEMFKSWNLKNEKIKTNTFHCSLNFAQEDNMDNDKLLDIAHRFMKDMGYQDVPYVIYRHYDAGHEHIHIVSSRIDIDGKKIKDSKELEKAMELCRVYEKEYHLKPLDSTFKRQVDNIDVQPNESNKFNKNYVLNAITKTLKNPNIYNFKLFQEALEKNYNIKVWNKNDKLVFVNLNDNNKVVNGSRIRTKLIDHINKSLSKNQEGYLKVMHQSNLKNAIKEANSYESISISMFRGILSKYGIQINYMDKVMAVDAPYFSNYVGTFIKNHSDIKEVENRLKNITPLNNRGEVLANKISCSVNSSVFLLKQHPNYDNAKNGSLDDAHNVLQDLYKQQNVSLLKKDKDVVLVPIPSKTNMLPLALADKLANDYGLEVDDSAKFQYKFKNTGANIWARILLKPSVEFDVVPGKKYYLVDDVFTTGNTIKAFKNHIEKNGGEVIGVNTIGAMNSMDLSITDAMKDKTNNLFGLDKFNQFLRDFKIADDINGLTSIELNYFLNHFNSIENLEARAIKEFSLLKDSFVEEAQLKLKNDVLNAIKERNENNASNKKVQLGTHNYEFKFESVDKTGQVIIEDDPAMVQEHSKMMQDLMAKIARSESLPQDEVMFFEQQNQLKTDVFSLIDIQNKITNGYPTFEQIISSINAHGFEMKINYEKNKEGIMKIQKFVVSDPLNNNAIQLDLMKLNHPRFNSYFLNNCFESFTERKENYKEIMARINNNIPIVSEVDTLNLRLIHNLSYQQVKDNSMYLKTIIQHNPQIIPFINPVKLSIIGNQVPLIENKFKQMSSSHSFRNIDTGTFSVEEDDMLRMNELFR